MKETRTGERTAYSRHADLQLLYIKQGRKALSKNFSPFIIIEESYLQTFSHSLEYDLIIEVKCTRPSMSKKTLTEELGADCFHYHAKNLYIYVYDKENLIKNPEAYKAAFRRSTEKAGKEIRMFINQKY